MTRRAVSRAAFTLIELLVVVAIIALLIAILLPSLQKARAQARTALCASRISQLSKALFLYGEDNDETPPFMGMGFESLRNLASKQYYGISAEQWARWEDWLMPDMPDIAYLAAEDWPNHVRIRNGSLFKYARFESLYRCPEFERTGVGRKSQNVFNYTRGLTCRKALTQTWDHDVLEQEGVSDEDMYPGPIMKPSQIYAPATMWMLFDEQWDYHCAIPIEEIRSDYHGGGRVIGENIYNFWMAIDCMQCICADALGSYHGPMGKTIDFEAIAPSKMGHLAYYDGHVDLFRDPVPGRDIGDCSQSEFLQLLVQGGTELFNMMARQVFSQRGLTLTLSDLPLPSPPFP